MAGSLYDDPDQVDAPTIDSDGNPMPLYRLAISVVVDSHGVDPTDATHRALAALRIPGGPFAHSVNNVHGPGQRWRCHATVQHAHTINWRQLEGDDLPPPFAVGDRVTNRRGDVGTVVDLRPWNDEAVVDYHDVGGVAHPYVELSHAG